MPRKTLFVTNVALALAAGCSAGDTGGGGECDACEMAVERVAMLGSADGDDALPGAVLSATLDSRGRILVGTHRGDRVLVFDTAGTLVTSFGRKGEGPGEFGGSINSIVRTRGDSFVVHDVGNRRLAAFAADGTPGWTAPEVTAYNGGGDLAALAGGGFVRSGEVGRGALASPHPLHLLDAQGRLVSSFGGDSSDATAPGTMYPSLAATPDGRVWAADRSRYRLVLWSTDGVPVRSIERTLDWFPPATSARPPSASEAPAPTIETIHLDAQDRLWVFIQVAAPDWTRGLGEARQGPHGVHHPVVDREAVYDAVIEVLDAATGELLASTRVPQRVSMSLGDGLAAAYLEDSLGVPRLELLRVGIRSGR